MIKEAFQIVACSRAGEHCKYIPTNWKNPPQPDKDQMLLIGRALMDFVSGDQLYTESGNSVTALSFFLYDHEMDFISSGCTCAMLCTSIPDDFQEFENLYLHVNKNKP